MTTAVILAGGEGTRLRPYTTVLPKPLMPVGEYAIIEILIRQLRRHGVRDLVIAVGYLASLIEAYCGDGSRWGVRIRYSHETERRGTAGPLTLIDRFDAPIVVVNGDLLTDLDFSGLLAFHEQHRPLITIGTFVREERISLGVLEVSDDQHILDYAEKPLHRYIVSMGAYVVSPQVLGHMQKDAYCDFPDLVRTLIQKKLPVMSYGGTRFWLDIGRVDDYETAVQHFNEWKPMLLPDDE